MSNNFQLEIGAMPKGTVGDSATINVLYPPRGAYVVSNSATTDGLLLGSFAWLKANNATAPDARALGYTGELAVQNRDDDAYAFGGFVLNTRSGYYDFNLDNPNIVLAGSTVTLFDAGKFKAVVGSFVAGTATTLRQKVWIKKVIDNTTEVSNLAFGVTTEPDYVDSGFVCLTVGAGVGDLITIERVINPE